jgi:mRNA-degrading endonuclease RelE of RelBE toxin-antitoxin system
MYDNIDIDSDIFKEVKDIMLDNDDEDIINDLENNVTKLIEVLKDTDMKLEEYNDNGYRERISVI